MAASTDTSSRAEVILGAQHDARRGIARLVKLGQYDTGARGAVLHALMELDDEILHATHPLAQLVDAVPA